ncbi:aspartate dehydrogenase [Thermoplasmatales archaeon ex4572_165]|nr:MAG: aspartate dehydrogenase [Thermoplasmatales archaeon ex4572_165]RLF59907.1 MAG: aspartate dehydrogenase [Thermoplasmata archaeon]
MKLGFIGCGAIGTDVAIAADSFEEISEMFLFDKDKKAMKKLDDKLKKSSKTTLETMIEKSDVIFEAASQEAVSLYGKKVLDHGKDLIIMSIGSLCNEEFRNELINTAKKNNCKIYLPSGAVCGIDGILSASIDKIDTVTLVTTKPPKAIDKTINKRTVIFRGTAREAVEKFPKNINVAANLSLAGIGFNDTYVEIVVDPVATRNSHKILAHGRFGRLRAVVENMPNPNNPGSSYLASLSAIATLKRIVNPIQIGA